MPNGRAVLADVVDGVLAGVAATWLMGRVTTLLYERERDAVRQREQDARGGSTAYGVAAEKAAHVVGRELSEDQRKRYGSRVHWALGAAAGAVYGVLRPRLSDVSAARGLAYGTAFWLLVDEGANWALGLTPGPTQFPWETHARGLAGHLAFGATADTVLRVLQPTA